jgi:hypothetical protein
MTYPQGTAAAVIAAALAEVGTIEQGDNLKVRQIHRGGRFALVRFFCKLVRK